MRSWSLSFFNYIWPFWTEMERKVWVLTEIRGDEEGVICSLCLISPSLLWNISPCVCSSLLLSSPSPPPSFLLSLPANFLCNIVLLSVSISPSPSESHSISFSPLKLLPSAIHLLPRPLSILFYLCWHDWLLKLGRFSAAAPANYPLQPQLCHPPRYQALPHALITPHCKGIISGRDQILKHDGSVLVFKWSWSCWFLIRGAEDA